MLVLAAALTLLTSCEDSPTVADANGQWGSREAGLSIAPSGGTLIMQCGMGTIDSGWTLTPSGAFSGNGSTVDGGGPDPIGGRPRRPSRFTGQISGRTFTLSVVVLATATTLGPFRMERDGAMVGPVCL